MEKVLETWKVCIEFKNDFENLGSAKLFINNQLKYSKLVKIERLETK